MKSLFLYIAFLGILSLSSCETIKLTPVDTCTMLSEVAICNDAQNTQDEDNDYFMAFENMRGYQCVSPKNYQKLQEEVSFYLAELAKLRRKCSRSLEE